MLLLLLAAAMSPAVQAIMVPSPGRPVSGLCILVESATVLVELVETCQSGVEMDPSSPDLAVAVAEMSKRVCAKSDVRENIKKRCQKACASKDQECDEDGGRSMDGRR